jgi:hypothetical protein
VLIFRLNLNLAILTKTSYILFFVLLAIILPGPVKAQDDEEPAFPLESIYAKRKPNTIRKVLRNVKFGVSIGGGNTYMAHTLEGFGVLQGKGFPPYIFPAGSAPTSLYSQWVNKVQPGQQTVLPDSYLVSSDTSELKFKGNALNIPLHFTIHYQAKNFRVGGGYGFEFMSVGTFESKTFSDKIGDFRPSDPNGMMKKYYGYLGYSFYRWNEIVFTGVLQVGGYKPGNNFDMSLITKSINTNLGVSVERDLSEYLGVFLKPSFDIKNYNISLPGTNQAIRHNMNAFYVQLGLTFSIPELPRCFHSECRVQMNHAHGNKEYRSRVHPLYKKQNPHYGENYPTLIKYKGKNKRKLNPY